MSLKLAYTIKYVAMKWQIKLINHSLVPNRNMKSCIVKWILCQKLICKNVTWIRWWWLEGAKGEITDKTPFPQL